MELALPKVNNPAYVAPVLLLLIIAPPLLIPVPFTVRTLVLVIVIPLRSKTAPEVIDAAPLLAPRAVALLTFKVPAEIVVPPEYVLAPESVIVPVSPEPPLMVNA